MYPGNMFILLFLLLASPWLVDCKRWTEDDNPEVVIGHDPIYKFRKPKALEESSGWYYMIYYTTCPKLL